MGDDGRTRAIQDAFPIAGKVHMIEADTRTQAVAIALRESIIE